MVSTFAFNREAIGPAVVPALRLAGEGKFKCETNGGYGSFLSVSKVATISNEIRRLHARSSLLKTGGALKLTV